MAEPALLSYPISTLVLYFCFYACAGWCMETVYCSILERRFVPRGFLHGPLCPIYGVGVVLMVLFFRPLAGNIPLFYLVSTLVMSAWEYFVGWFLEVTTHMKYWDYSMYRFNLKGRICLWVCLVWGVLSYVCVFWLHPPVERAVSLIPAATRQVLAAALTAAVLADAAVTVRELALMTKALHKLQQVGGQMQAQMAELSDKLQDAREAMASLIPEAVSEGSAKLRAAYDELISNAERRTRRFRRTYAHLNAPRVDAAAKKAVHDKAQEVAQAKGAKRASK